MKSPVCCRRPFSMPRPAALPVAGLLALLVAASGEAAGDEAGLPVVDLERKEPVDFARDIFPIFKKNCLACHNASRARGDVVLENPESIREGAEDEPIIVPGKAEESLLFLVAAHRKKPFMPPRKNKSGAKNLTPEELALLKAWIDEGAKGSAADLAAEVEWHPLPPGLTPILACALSPDGFAAACARANQVFIYDLVRGRELTRLTDRSLIERGVYDKPGVAHLDVIHAMAFHPYGGFLATAGFRTVKIWKRGGAEPSLEIALPEGEGPAAARLDPNASRFAVARGGRIGVVDLAPADGAPRFTEIAQAAGVKAVCRLGEELVASAVEGGSALVVLAPAGGKELARASCEDPVTALCALEGGGLAAGHRSGAVSVWKTSPEAAAGGKLSLEQAASFKAHETPVTQVQALEGGRLLTAGGDGAVRLWALEGGKRLREFQHGSPVVALASAAKRLVSAGADGTARLWNVDNGKKLADLSGDAETDLRKAALAARVKLWSDRHGELSKALEAARKALAEREAALKKAQEALAKAQADVKAKKEALEAAKAALAAAEKQAAELADRAAKAEGEEAKTAAARAAEAKQAVDAAKKKLEESRKAVAAAEDALKKAEAPATNEKAAYESAGAQHDELSARLEETAAALDAAKAALEAFEKEAPGNSPCTAAAVSPDGALVALGDERGRMRLFRAGDGKPARTIETGGGAVAALVFVSEEKWVALCASGPLRVYDLRGEWPLVHVLGGPDDRETFTGRVTACAFSRDGALFAGASGEPSRRGELKVFRTADWSLVWALPEAHTDAIYDLEFSPDDRCLATASADKFVKVFDARTGKELRKLEGHTHHVFGVSWRHDGKFLASAGADKVIKIWDFEKGEQTRTIGGFGKQVTRVRFLDATSNIVSSSGDKTVRLHSADNGRNYRNLGGATDYVYSVAVTPDGKLAAAGGFDGVLRIWDPENGKLLHAFEPPQAGAK